VHFVGHSLHMWQWTAWEPKLCNMSRNYIVPRHFHFNPLTPELNPTAQRCLTRFFTGDSLTVHFINMCVKNQQIHQLYIQFINYVMVAPTRFGITLPSLVPSERCSTEEQSIEHCGWACCVYWRGAWRSQISTPHARMYRSLNAQRLSERSVFCDPCFTCTVILYALYWRL
jgi:hypothetical protein